METKNSSETAPKAPAIKKEGGKKKIIIIIIAVLIALLSVGAIIYFIFFKLENNGVDSGKPNGKPNINAAKFPDIIPGLTVSKTIPAKTGGQISATNDKGVKVTIDIPAGSLKEDTTVTIDPAEPADEDSNNPDEGNNGNGDNPNGDDGNNPPEDEPDDDGDAPPPPTCPNGICGAGETCANCPSDCGACPPPPPPSPTCPNGICGAGETCSSCPSDCGDCPPPNPPEEPADGGFPFGGFVIGPNTLVFNPSATATFTLPAILRIKPGMETVISVGRSGGSRVLPTTPLGGGSFSVPIGGGGAIIPDDSSGGGGGGNGGGDGGGGSGGSGGGSGGGTGGGEAGGVGDPANNAAIASGGKCTPEFLEAIKGMKDFAEGAPGHAAYDAALRDCLEVEKLKEQCENDPITLRRRHFETRINIANDLDVEVANELKNLLASCVAKYEIANQGAYSDSGVQTSVRVNASLCGYVDDEWKGTYSYTMIVMEGGSGDCIGTTNFRLPFGGGYFTAGVRCENTATILGRTISIPGGGFVFTGTFMEPSRVVLNLFGAYIVKDTAITLKERNCIDAAYPDVPPLSGDDEIPLVPIRKP